MTDQTILRNKNIEEKATTFSPPLEIEKPQVYHEESIGIKTPSKKKVLVRCPDCPWRAGLKDEHTHCLTCKGTGKVEADPLE